MVMNNLEMGKETNLDKNNHQLLTNACKLQYEPNKRSVAVDKTLPNSNTSLSNCHRKLLSHILLKHCKEYTQEVFFGTHMYYLSTVLWKII